MLFLMILLFTVVQSSYQATYSCNSTAVCGCSTNTVSISRVVGGENAETAAWGWAVSISIADTYLCGGSIISSSWVITAAHCVLGHTASQITVYAGSNLPESGTQIKVVSQIIMHPNYMPTTYENDIALLRLSSPLTMSDPYISPICIPSVSAETLSSGEWPAAGTTVVAVGWGRLYEGGTVATTLQQVTLSTIDYQSSTCVPVIRNKNIQFCAGANGKDTCQGDSGGPLMMFTPSNQWVLVGLTSNGIGCARPQYSGIYTRVAAYENWINSNTNGSYSSVPLSRACNTQISVYFLLFFILLNFLPK